MTREREPPDYRALAVELRDALMSLLSLYESEYEPYEYLRPPWLTGPLAHAATILGDGDKESDHGD